MGLVTYLVSATITGGIGYLIAKWRRMNPLLGAGIGFFCSFLGLAIFLIISLLIPGEEFGIGHNARFNSTGNPSYQTRSAAQLYCWWRNSNDGVAVDLQGQAIWVSKQGKGRWFGIGEIKRYGLAMKLYRADFYIVTSDPNFPEFSWTIFNRNFYTFYEKLERALASAGHFS